jgi:predicted GNAT family acetyltransferase
VNGPREAAERFADAWTAVRGGAWKVRTHLRIHKLLRVTPALTSAGGSGSLRKATLSDLELASEWLDAFVRDTRIEPPAEGAQNAAARMIERGALYLWTEDNAPLSMVGAGRETPTGCAVNCVYTPPNARRRGHATAAVAALSNSLLDQGRKFCCLYTDAANPTSNSIYAKIGYEPIRDDSEIAFLP